ncbi:HNH endonuclease [Nocardioides daphniae]|uniref:HNH nuclease domain-containing protein n=1 Tax=Nocardioides daphniae TaxID=402297 RepID=A0A4P7UDT0_9ACTN|nr:HNH endonuclease [Nocardioides daphniae]QCC77498.1 hypothetical protein E2C04_10500 [Nocardioides daphniae]GGD31407.1 hypothetical protein GCM10007231_33710 [Nocardioides daphniae]
MRKIERSSKPATLVKNSDLWTENYLNAVKGAKKDLPTPWKHPEIRSALEGDTFKKCAYCEVLISDCAYAHIEHIEPKSKVPSKVVEWENLTLACPRCNQNKSDYYEPQEPLLNPYADEPNEHLEFLAGGVYARPGSLPGRRTVLHLDLQRADLLWSRMTVFESFKRLLRLWEEADGEDRQLAALEVGRMLHPTNEFSAFLVAEARRVNFPVT